MPKKNKLVYIVSDSTLPIYRELFAKEGWIVTPTMQHADLIQFIDGPDISPSLYKDVTHPKTVADSTRDQKEKMVFHWCLKHNRPMAGIGRGGNFLNALSGGKMWQHVVGHHYAGGHLAHSIVTNKTLLVTSTHHQEMIPGPSAHILMVAYVATAKEKVSRHLVDDQRMNISRHFFPRLDKENPLSKARDIEALWYGKYKTLCFQPRPECGSETTFPGLRSLYFEYINRFLFR